MSLARLQRAMNFETVDLEANRSGKLSERQREAYRPPEFNPLVLWVLGGHAAVILLLLGSIAVLTGSRAMWTVLVIVMMLALLPFVLLRNEGNIQPALRADVARGKVAKVCGYVVPQERKSRGVSTFHLSVAGITLRLTRKQTEGFVSGQPYCLYYLPDSRTLLTAEPTTDQLLAESA